MKVYNTKHLNNKQRFTVAIIAGIISALLCGLAYALIETMLPVHIPLLYVAMAYGVSYVVKTFGRGVQSKFTVVGIISFLLSVLFGYIILYIMSFGFNFYFLTSYLSLVMVSMFSLDVHGIIELLCIAYSVYIAYYNSRIL